MNNYDKDCLKCNKKYYTPECFNQHPGSIIALGKIANWQKDKKNKDIHIIKNGKQEP